MSFRIKYLCAVAIKPSSNHQKKLANVSIAAYFLLGPAIAPDMWASRTLARNGILSNSSCLVAKDLPIPGEDSPSHRQFSGDVAPALILTPRPPPLDFTPPRM
jgi:hypothetical protein